METQGENAIEKITTVVGLERFEVKQRKRKVKREKIITKPIYFQPNYTNRGKGPRDPVTQRFTRKCAFALKEIPEEEQLETVISPKTSTPEQIDETQTSNGMVDLTPTTRGSSPDNQINGHNGEQEGIRKSFRKIKPVNKYGGIPYSTKYKNR